MKLFRIRLLAIVARLLGVPFRVRDEYWLGETSGVQTAEATQRPQA